MMNNLDDEAALPFCFLTFLVFILFKWILLKAL